jgi:hypothetical protein
MFGFFKKKRPPADSPTEPANPPTEKQRRYAARIGIKVSPSMTKDELSHAIADAERKNPAIAERREQVKGKMREQKFGKALIDEESRWSGFADEGVYILAVYVYRKETIVDVLQVNGAYIHDRGKLILEVAAPKVIKDRYIGDHLEWDKNFELPIESLRYHEPLPQDFYEHDAKGFQRANKAYKETVEKGLKIARKLK